MTRPPSRPRRRAWRTFQTAVNKLAAATYMGGRTDGMNAMMTAESPQQLIDKMALQRVLGTQMSTQMTSYRAAGEQAAKAEQASLKSAAEAKNAAEQAAAVRAGLQKKQSELQVQIAVVKSQYVSLSPQQRTALADPGPVPAVRGAARWAGAGGRTARRATARRGSRPVRLHRPADCPGCPAAPERSRRRPATARPSCRRR